jgi:hypothetical protein
MSSSGNTASANACAREGWARTYNTIRSVVSHPLALPLVLCLGFFDAVDTTDQLKGDRSMSCFQSLLSKLDDVDMTDKRKASGEHFKSYLQSLLSQPETISTEDIPSAEVHAVPSTLDKLRDMAWLVDDLNFMTTVETVFSTFSLGKLHADLKVVFNGMRSNGSNETALVADILKTFRACACSLLFQSEGGVKFKNITGEGVTCRYDLLVAQPASDRGFCTPILLFEFGLDNSKWWQKLDQAYNYVDLLTSPENIDPITEPSSKIDYKPRFDKPMLMSTITIAKESGAFRIALFLCWRRQDEPRKAAKKLKGSGKPVDGFDMVLLWRSMWINGPTQHQGEDVNSEDIDSENIDHPGSNEFAVSLVAIFVAMQCLKDWQRKSCSENNFLVLGPNCCKVKLVQVR